MPGGAGVAFSCFTQWMFSCILTFHTQYQLPLRSETKSRFSQSLRKSRCSVRRNIAMVVAWQHQQWPWSWQLSLALVILLRSSSRQKMFVPSTQPGGFNTLLKSTDRKTTLNEHTMQMTGGNIFQYLFTVTHTLPSTFIRHVAHQWKFEFKKCQETVFESVPVLPTGHILYVLNTKQKQIMHNTFKMIESKFQANQQILPYQV